MCRDARPCVCTEIVNSEFFVIGYAELRFIIRNSLLEFLTIFHSNNLQIKY